MRRFFISGFERLLNVLTIMSVLAVAALAARIAVEAAPGDTREYLTAAAVLVGGWLAVVALAGISFLAIAMHDNSRRMIGLMAQGNTGVRPLTATRKPERAATKPRPAPLPEPEYDAWDDQQEFDEPVAAPRPAPKPAAQAPRPIQHPVERPVFSGRSMPRTDAEPAPAMRAPVMADIAVDEPVAQHPVANAPVLDTPTAEKPAIDSRPMTGAAVAQKAPVDPAPSQSSVARAPRLVAERRFPR